MTGIPNWIHSFEYNAKTYGPGTVGMGYMFEHAVHDLEADIGLFKPSPFSVDTGLEKAKNQKETAEEILGDILPVRIEGRTIGFSPAHAFIQMMDMETMFISMMDYPELFHKIMRRLTDDHLAFMDAMETGGALMPSNDSNRIAMDSYCFTNDLPNFGDIDRPIKIADLWGYTNFQETVGMSVEMFDEFFFSYTKEVFSRCGLFSYGCCEPVHTLWETCLSKMKNLRKVSVSPWCDEEYMGEAIRGKKIVYHRKPFPNFIAVDEVFDDEAFLDHLKKTVMAARGCPLEITFRDICSVRNEPERLTRAVELTREAFARWYQ
jgi:hypothetical protein